MSAGRLHNGQRHRDSAFAHTDATVRHAFIQLMQLQNEQRQELMAKGAVCQEMPASITTSMPCGRYVLAPASPGRPFWSSLQASLMSQPSMIRRLNDHHVLANIWLGMFLLGACPACSCRQMHRPVSKIVCTNALLCAMLQLKNALRLFQCWLSDLCLHPLCCETRCTD